MLPAGFVYGFIPKIDLIIPNITYGGSMFFGDQHSDDAVNCQNIFGIKIVE